MHLFPISSSKDRKFYTNQHAFLICRTLAQSFHPKMAPPPHFIIYSNTCQQRESADFHPTTSDFCGKTALFCGKSTNKEVTGSSQADPSGSRIIQAVSRRIFLMLRGLLICSVAASLLFNRHFSDGSHDW